MTSDNKRSNVVDVVLLKSRGKAMSRSSAASRNEGVCSSCWYIREDMKKISEQQEKIFKLLYGNGSEGLVTTLAKLNQKQSIIWAIFGVLGAAHVTVISFAARDILKLI